MASSTLDSFISSSNVRPTPLATSSEIRDRGSLFIASIYRASSPSSASKCHAYHKNVVHGSNPATHEICAWRCMNLKMGCDGLGGPDDFELVSGKDDDGEDNGGRSVLRTMEKEGVIDAIVIVSRWFGGMLLGPVRFTHIETCTREVCRRFKLIEEVEGIIEELKEVDEQLAQLRSELAEIQNQGAPDPAELGSVSSPASTHREPPDYRAILLSPSPDLERAKRLITARQRAIRSVKEILVQAKGNSSS
ncbi:hypothetical protein ACEPAI_2652 [Sanghuangporus weigelae]